MAAGQCTGALVSTEYFSHSRPEVLGLVERPPHRALDVGCGRGAFALELKRRFGCEVWGIEPDERAAREAAGRLDRVIAAAFDAARDELAGVQFDAVFFNDVLEHMADPYGALGGTRTLLAGAGRVYASVPNVLFAPHLLEVLATKDWRYRDAGILDRTHLRFFTRKSAVRLFEDAGFAVERLIALNALRSWKWRALTALSGGYLADMLPMQYGIVAAVRP